MSLLIQLNDTLNSGDPLVRTWPLVRDYYTPFILSTFYLLMVTRIIPSWMKHRPPLDLRYLMVVYNIVVVSSYSFILLSLLYHLLTTDCLNFLCKEFKVRQEDYTYSISKLCWVIYLLKYIEFSDTVFFALRKKTHLITNLHVIHHAALPIICWVLIRVERTGFQMLPGVLNSTVHVIMYAYYALAAMGPRIQKYLWWKKHLTMIQIAQFVLILIYMLFIGPLIGCKTSIHGLAMLTFFAVLFFLLFFNFYYKTYVLQYRAKLLNASNSPCSSKTFNGSCSDKKYS